MMNQWIKIKQNEKSIAEYLKLRNYKDIAIYGMSYVGQTLSDELKKNGINIAFGIDNNAGLNYKEIDVIYQECITKKIDVIIVTAIMFFLEIEEKVAEYVNCPIISLEDILNEL